MVNPNKNTEAVLQNLEKVARLVLEPQYKNEIISPTINSSVFGNNTPTLAVEIISNKIWHSNAKLETYNRNNMAFKCRLSYLQK